MIQVAVFDIDDTLYDMKNKRFIPSAVEGIKLLQKKKIIVILATGRPPLTAKTICVEGVSPDYIVCSNGHLILDSHNKVLREHTFDNELVSEVYQYCMEHQIGLLWKYPEKVYEYIHADIFDTFYQKTAISEKNVVKNQTNIHMEKNPNGGCLGCNLLEMTYFNQKFEGQCVAVKINDTSSDLMLFGINKKNSVELLLHDLHISPEYCIAFGDNMNDMEMLRYAGIGVCVGNGCEELKKIADYVTDDIKDDGIFNALSYFGLV